MTVELKQIEAIGRVPVVFELGSGSKDGAIAELVRRMAEAGVLQPEAVPDVVCAVMGREDIGSTASGHGLAFPRAPTDQVAGCHMILGRSSRGIDFQALDGLPVTLIYLGLFHPECRAEYVELMKALIALLRREHIWEDIERAASAEELLKAILPAGREVQLR